MRSDVVRDLSASALDFSRVVWPALAPKLGGGEIVPIEAVSHDGFNKELDTLAGIDAWLVRRSKAAICGVASRVQWGRAWNTFTIRISRPSGASTEYEKRLRAIDSRDHGLLYPHYTIQGYVEDPKGVGDLLSACAVRTLDLFTLARRLYERGEFTNVKNNPRCGWGLRTAYSKEVLLWVSWAMVQKNMQCAIAAKVKS